MIFDVHEQFLGPEHMTKQVQNSHYDGGMERWDCDKYVTLQKEQHTVMKGLIGLS